MIIRTMQLEDYDKLYQLWLSCQGMGLNHLDDSQEGVAVFLRRNPKTCFVAEAGKNLIGAIMAGHDGRRGYIYHTAVHPDCRRQKIASSLVKHSLEALKEEGIHKVALLVFTKNQTANAFWESVGFTKREDITYRNKALSSLCRIDI
ncbi:GNAT family N-acetyltransferase [Streptococcus sp. H49]|uniref:GNAT family N-acetyltransferase n=1 Tax=Streptococcus huangxiaojuni TaxID=3237239 RepID=UPI0034A2A6CF